jgi:NAD(P)-dependent dehydrogenase (short-subunit alcohol dehydrogenase family)
MAATLITGSNKGLGYETARQLIAAGDTVYIGARDPERGREAFPGIKINAVDPGYTATDLNGGTGTQTIQQGAQIIVKMGPGRPGRPHRQCRSANDVVATTISSGRRGCRNHAVRLSAHRSYE